MTNEYFINAFSKIFLTLNIFMNTYFVIKGVNRIE